MGKFLFLLQKNLFSPFMKKNLSDLFNLSEIKKFIFKRDNLKTEYCKSILEGKYQEATTSALKLFDTCPSYLLLAYFMQLSEDKENANVQKLMEILLERQEPSPDVSLLMAKENMFIDIPIKFLKTSRVKDYIYQIIKKELVVNGHLPFEEDILDELDDWSLYEYCLSNNIDVKRRDTINYKYYVVHKYKKDSPYLKKEYDEACEYLFRRIRIFKDLQYLSRVCEVSHHEDYVTDCLLKFISSGHNLEKAREIYMTLKPSLEEQSKKYNALEDSEVSSDCKKFDSSDKFNLFKCLLGHLVASRDVNLLVLALYLTFSYRKAFVSNYEISLIHLFLCRFFCFYKSVRSLFEEFDVKNNQFFNLSFIWSDLAIVMRIKDSSMVKEYQTLLSENINVIEKTLKHFIEKNKIPHSLSLIKVHRALKKEVVSKEIKTGKILSESSESLFSDLLGPDCGYLFRKLTVEDVSDRNSNLTTLFGDPLPYAKVEDLLENPVEKIKDEKFLCWFKGNLFSL